MTEEELTKIEKRRQGLVIFRVEEDVLDLITEVRRLQAFIVRRLQAFRMAAHPVFTLTDEERKAEVRWLQQELAASQDASAILQRAAASSARAEERECCAKVAEELDCCEGSEPCTPQCFVKARCGAEIAAAIRALK